MFIFLIVYLLSTLGLEYHQGAAPEAGTVGELGLGLLGCAQDEL